MKFGKLEFEVVREHVELVAPATRAALERGAAPGALVAEIDAALSDTAAFCEAYEVLLDEAANCVVIEAKRADRVWYAACLVLAVDRADVNGDVRRYLDARRTTFAPMETAVRLTGMEYGGITPVGLPDGWPVLVDTRVAQLPWALIGSGIRASKLLVPGAELGQLPGAVVMDIIKES
jgi:prolyl-tRNA editing enzyme YbaK/EbsC (Cys-tRNA(Pro) deacylase)